MSRIYAKPPVTEAVLEVRFTKPIVKAALERIVRRVKKRFPSVESELQFNVAIAHGRVDVNQAPAGFKLTSADALSIALLRGQGVASSRLAPYQGWENFQEQTQYILEQTRKVIGRPGLQRVGLRYINRLDIPQQAIRTDDWLRIGAQVPDGLGDVVEDLNVSVVLPLDGLARARVACQSIPSPLLDHGSILLDIDVFVTDDIPIGDEGLWALITTLRGQKNRVFESCITDRMRQQFGEVQEG